MATTVPSAGATGQVGQADPHGRNRVSCAVVRTLRHGRLVLKNGPHGLLGLSGSLGSLGSLGYLGCLGVRDGDAVVDDVDSGLIKAP